MRAPEDRTRPARSGHPGPRRRLFGTGVFRWSRRLGRALLLVGAAWLLGLILWPPPDPYRVRPSGRVVLARDGTLLRGFLSPDRMWRLRTPLADMSEELQTAVLLHEDRRFRRHPGVDPLAAVRALAQNIRAGRVVSGASTITMQLARLVEPRPRTLLAKLRQTARALQYEWRYSKDEILEMYLNLAPYGGNMEGVGAASRALFGRPPDELSVAEACLLAILPQAPAAHDPLRHPEAARTARDGLLEQLLATGQLDSAAAARARQEPLPRARRPLPFLAPHFCDWLARRDPEPTVLRSTLDLALQTRVGDLLAERVDRLREVGIGQAAAVVLDAERSELLAMVGSADFHDFAHEGQVNGALARRSPGSTLKPFVYGLAFARGLIAPRMLIEDLPLHFGSYSPENFDGTYEGILPVGEALRASRNVPAVALAAALGPDTLHGWLRAAGVHSLDRPAEHYGLALVLGGCEVTLLELAEVYGLLARQGDHRPLRVLKADPQTPPVSLLSREAAWLTLRELSDVPAPDSWASRGEPSRQRPIAWKTGTSYGHRDAWSVGICGPYVVAVWAGNFDGQGVPPLVGREVAGPLLFAIADLLPRERSGRWQVRPPGIAEREVCGLSGAPPGPHCPARRREPFIPGVSPCAPCSLHQVLEIDPVTAEAVCSRCRGTSPIERRVIVRWPERVASRLRGAGTAGEPPPHRASCPVFGHHEPPRILSPQQGMVYQLRPTVPREHQQLLLDGAASGASRTLYWFLDGELWRKVQPGERTFLDPAVGMHRITLADETGRTSSVDITILPGPRGLPDNLLPPFHRRH